MKIKIFFMLLFMIFIIAIFSTDSKAVTILGKEFPDFPDVDTNLYPYINITYENRVENSNYGEYVIHFNKQPSYVSSVGLVLGGNSSKRYIVRNYNCLVYSWNPSKGDTSWIVSNDGEEYASEADYLYYYDDASVAHDGEYYMIYSNHKIVYNLPSDSAYADLNGTDFFYPTPLTISTTMQSPIGANIWQMVARIILVVIPIVVSYLGLRKGLRMLSMLLHKS